MRRILPILLLAAMAACTKDKDPDRPVNLVAFPATLKIQKVWTEKVGGTKVPLRLGLALDVEGNTVYAAGAKGDKAAALREYQAAHVAIGPAQTSNDLLDLKINDLAGDATSTPVAAILKGK